MLAATCRELGTSSRAVVFLAALALVVVEAHSRAASLLSDRWRMRALTLVCQRPGGIVGMNIFRNSLR